MAGRTQPARSPAIRNAPRGRVESSPGGPVVAPESPVFTLGIPYFAWAAGSMHTSGGSGG